MAKAKRAALTAERANELLRYNAFTGELTWKIARGGKARAGTVAGTVMHGNTGTLYRQVSIDGIGYLAHRLIKFMVDGKWPKCMVDHANGDSLCNAWTNLRDATESQNTANSKLYSTNKSGFKGVYWHKLTAKWRATIGVNGKKIYLGYFVNILEAAAAYAKAAAHYFGEFANFGQTDLAVAMAA